MAFDFPNTPTVGDTFTPPGSLITYRWNGQAWSSPSTSEKAVVYADGSVAMTGQLTVVDPPVNPTDAASKAYVDSVSEVSVPSGSVMLFYNAAAPVGWTKDTTNNDKAIRVTSGAGGVVGGTNPFSTVMAQTVVGNHTNSAAENSTITSSAAQAITVYPGGNTGLAACYSGSGFSQQGAVAGASPGFVTSAAGTVGSTASFTATNTINVTSNNTSGTPHNHPITMAIQYLDVIVCSKD